MDVLSSQVALIQDDSLQEPLRFVCGFEVAELSYLPLQRTLFAAGKHLSGGVLCSFQYDEAEGEYVHIPGINFPKPVESFKMFSSEDGHNIALTLVDEFCTISVVQLDKASRTQIQDQSAAYATALDVCEGSIAVCTEDGQILQYQQDRGGYSNIWREEHADPLGLEDIRFNNSIHQLMTCGAFPSGQLKLWDTRAGTGPAAMFKDPDDNAVYTCFCTSEADANIVYCGTNAGQIVRWDTRYEATPIAIQAHVGRVTKLRAPRLSTAPTVFSCSEDGKVLQSLLSANEQEVRESASDVLIDEPSAITSMFIEERIGRRQMLFAGMRTGQIVVRDILSGAF